MARGRTACAAVGVAIGVGALACVPPQGGWDPDALAARLPEAQGARRTRLADSPPYFVPDDRGLQLFLCRWPDGAPIRVALPASSATEERHAMEAALTAWEASGLGVAFELAPPERAQIRVAFEETVDAGAGTGDTVASCAVSGFAESGGPVAAHLHSASIRLHRARLDVKGQVVRLDAAELAGTLAHELGHALGHPGHAALGRSVLVRELEIVREWGSRVLAGEAIEAPAVALLYRLPSGTRIGRVELAPRVSSELAALQRRAKASGWDDPLCQVGDRNARIVWRGPAGARATLTVEGWPGVVAHPDRFERSAVVEWSAEGR